MKPTSSAPFYTDRAILLLRTACNRLELATQARLPRATRSLFSCFIFFLDAQQQQRAPPPPPRPCLRLRKVQESKETVRVSFGVDRPLVTAEAVKRRLMEMSREQGMTKSTATIYKVRQERKRERGEGATAWRSPRRARSFNSPHVFSLNFLLVHVFVASGVSPPFVLREASRPLSLQAGST